MVERRDDLDLVYECPAGRYVYPTNLVTTGQAKRLAAISPHAEKKKKLEKSSQTQLPSTCVCGGESQGRDLSRFFCPSALSYSPNHVPKAHLTLPYLTLPMLPMLPIEARNKKHPQKTAVPKQQLDALDAVDAVVGGEPTNRVLKVLWFLPSTWVRFLKKIRCTILSIYLPTCRYGTFYQVKLYLLSPPISFSRSMHLSLFLSLALGRRYLLPTQPPTPTPYIRYM